MSPIRAIALVNVKCKNVKISIKPRTIRLAPFSLIDFEVLRVTENANRYVWAAKGQP
jgi:hypothetical protein